MIKTKSRPNFNGQLSANDYMAIVEENVIVPIAQADDSQLDPTVFDQVEAFDGDTDQLKLWALDIVPELAQLNRRSVASFGQQLVSRGVTSEWVRRELRPAINEEKRAYNGKTWVEYVEAAQAMGYEFRLNDLEDSLEVNGQRMTDVIEAELLSRLHAQGLKNADIARRAFLTKAARDRYHPVKAYLVGLVWDDKDHIAMLASYFEDAHEPIAYVDGSQRSVIHAWLHRWLVGAVGKVYDSSEAQNPMLILDGLQGAGKSYLVKWLCPVDNLHFEGAIRPDDKDYLRYLTTRLVWEVSELGATMRKADREALKAFITLQDATYRPSYGRHPLHKPALASFIGTVNFEGALLSDPTGHRRFLPVELVSIDWAYSQDVDIDQLWAQAYALYHSGESWQLTDEERAVHSEIAGSYEAEDPFHDWVNEYFDVDPAKSEWFMTTADVAAVLEHNRKITISSKPQATYTSIGRSLSTIGLTKKRKPGGGPRGWYGIRASTDVPRTTG